MLWFVSCINEGCNPCDDFADEAIARFAIEPTPDEKLVQNVLLRLGNGPQVLAMLASL